MTSRKTTIFRQLIFNIIIPTLLTLLLVSAYHFYNTRSLIAKGNDLRNNIISKEITKIIKFQDLSLNLIDEELNTRFKELSDILVNDYFSSTDNIKNADLISVMKKLGMDAINEDIYIVSSNGIIINTTREQDKGLNLFGFGEKTREFLLEVFKSGDFNSPVYGFESRTNQIRKYSYQPTKDRKYIIELGAYSKKAVEIIRTIEETKYELKMETPGIIDVELFLMADVPFTLNKEVMELINQKDTLLRAFQDKDTISFIEHFGKQWYQYQYIYIESSGAKDKSGSTFYKGSVIRIISDRTPQMALFRVEAARFALVFIISIGILSLLIYRKTKDITLPIKKLVKNVDIITRGNLQERAEVTGNNEITILAEQFNNMVGNIESKNRTLNKQKTEIEEINAEMTASINYAKYIQSSILPAREQFDLCLKDYFILFRPKDIVSGDFSWITKIENKTIIAAVDCTGHGVPGAFMSMLGAAFLNEIIKKECIIHPGVILQRMRQEIIRSLQQKGEIGEQKDGMDLALCVIDYENMKLQFAGANNPLYIVRKSNNKDIDEKKSIESDGFALYEFKGDQMPIGIHDKMDDFTLNEINLIKGDSLYLFTDGFADQFGGPNGKQLQYRNFKKMLLDHCSKSMEEQKIHLEEDLKIWQGDYSQIDDILVIGVRIS